MASILLHLPAGTDLYDPDPEFTAKRDVELVSEWDDSVIGVVGWSSAGIDAVRTASEHAGLERLVIVSTPFPDDGELEFDLSSVSAKTLLLLGSADPAAGSKHGKQWQQALPDARLEMVPKAGSDILDTMWKRILSHLAPGRKA